MENKIYLINHFYFEFNFVGIKPKYQTMLGRDRFIFIVMLL